MVTKESSENVRPQERTEDVEHTKIGHTAGRRQLHQRLFVETTIFERMKEYVRQIKCLTAVAVPQHWTPKKETGKEA